MKLNILGTEYKVVRKNYDECEDFKEFEWAAYCNEILKEIVMCNVSTFPGLENESEEHIIKLEKQNLRHEIIHAFLNESGLSNNTYGIDHWAKNEEMIDWIAIQFSKILEVFKEADCM